jgi:hypothetical protein
MSRRYLGAEAATLHPLEPMIFIIIGTRAVPACIRAVSPL